MRQGFTLIELAIVLVIIGLLAGGVLVGQSMMRSAELRSVVTDHGKFVSAIKSFKDQYFALPGDMPNATQFWGASAAGAACATTAAVGTATCDGNADGKVIGGLPATTNEAFRFWQHLANAGLIEGRFTGIKAGVVDWSASTANSPQFRGSNTLWFTWNWGSPSAGNTNWYAGDYGNRLSIGEAVANAEPYGTPFTPEEAWGIDIKMDDGKPGRGRVLATNRDSCDTSASETDYTGEYLLTNNTRICSLVFPKAY